MKMNNKGMSLALVLMVLAVLSILGATLLFISLAETKMTVYQDKKMQAYYLAKSGADSIAKYIIRNPKNAQQLVAAPESSANSQLSNGTFVVDVQQGASSNELIVLATGTAGGVSNTAKAVMRSLSFKEIIDKAIYSNGPLDITGMNVSGDVQSGGNIYFSNNGSNAYYDTPHPNSTREPALKDFPSGLPEYSPYSDISSRTLEVKNQVLDFYSGFYIHNLIIDNNAILNVHPGNSLIKILVDDLTVKGKMYVKQNAGETGSVELYINHLATVSTQGEINSDEPYHLAIILATGSKFVIQADMLLNAYILGPSATVEIQSGNTVINGGVIANVVQKNDSNSSANGTVNYVPPPANSVFGDGIIEYRLSRWEK